ANGLSSGSSSSSPKGLNGLVAGCPPARGSNGLNDGPPAGANGLAARAGPGAGGATDSSQARRAAFEPRRSSSQKSQVRWAKPGSAPGGIGPKRAPSG